MPGVFLTGGSSAWGRLVMDRLLPHRRIIAATHRRPIPAGPAIEPLNDALEQCEKYADRIRAADVVLHMAAITHTDDNAAYHAVNVRLTERLLAVCRRDQRVVYVSSICAHESGGAYGRSKWLAEQAVLAAVDRPVIIRPSEIYGLASSEGIDNLIRLAVRSHILPDFRHSGGSVPYSPVAADEAAQFVADVVTRLPAEGRAYTLCNDRTWTARDMARALRAASHRVLSVPVPILILRALASSGLPLPFKRDQLDRMVVPKVYDDSAARRDYAFHPRPFLEYLASVR